MEIVYDSSADRTIATSDSNMVTSHSLILINILPETTYYYEVQSTDASENTATDNNNGR